MKSLLRFLGVRIVLRRYQAILLVSVLLLSSAVIPASLDSSIRFPPPAPVMPAIDSAQGPWIALTFDDGPHPGKTEKLLAILRDAAVPATFFVVGKMADRYPTLLQDMAREGHELANHTYTHPTLSRLSNADILRELDQTRDVVQRLTGKTSDLWRPPGGDFSRRIVKLTSGAGYRMVLWTVLVPDVRGAAPVAMRKRILTQAGDGAIVLMHSGMPNTIEMLPDVIAQLKARHYHFTTVSELLKRSRHAQELPRLQTVSNKKY